MSAKNGPVVWYNVQRAVGQASELPLSSCRQAYSLGDGVAAANQALAATHTLWVGSAVSQKTPPGNFVDSTYAPGMARCPLVIRRFTRMLMGDEMAYECTVHYDCSKTRWRRATTCASPPVESLLRIAQPLHQISPRSCYGGTIVR